MAIYSRCVNARQKLDKILPEAFPWCAQWADELKKLFEGYVDRKESGSVLDYDDLLLYLHAMLAINTPAMPSERCSIACWLMNIRTRTRCKPK